MNAVPSLADLVRHARYEVLPTASILDTIGQHVPAGRTITVTASPAKPIQQTVDLACALSGGGWDAVPHLAARMISGRDELTDLVAQLTEAGVHTVFVPGGDQDPPAGDYRFALDLLQDLTAMGNPFAEVGITGYPASHPTISDDLTVQSMWDKRAHSTQVVSNLNFDPKVIEGWTKRMRARGVDQPLWLGMPGPIDRTKLLTMASKIGVGDSTKFLSKHKGTFARLAAPGGFTGERFLRQCYDRLSRFDSRLGGLHIFTFNQVQQTEAWRTQLIESALMAR